MLGMKDSTLMKQKPLFQCQYYSDLYFYYYQHFYIVLKANVLQSEYIKGKVTMLGEKLFSFYIC